MVDIIVGVEGIKHEFVLMLKLNWPIQKLEGMNNLF